MKKISDYLWEIDTNYKAGMKVKGRIFADEELIKKAEQDRGIDQVANVAFLPGIINYSIAMPDIHWGYGFPIGGVAAMSLDDGVISPGGVGFDINCGVRLLLTNLAAEEIKTYLLPLANELGRAVPKGVGSKSQIRLSDEEMRRVMTEGAKWVIGKGFGWKEDVEHIEENGRLDGANPEKVSHRAMERGFNQLGSLGAGNHFLEVQRVDRIFRQKEAEAFGLFEGQVVIMIHSGSRGAGHQICSDYIKIMDALDRKLGIELPDRQLGYAPINSKEGKDYYAAMACAVNYAFSNRQCLAHWTRKSFEYVFKKSAEELGMKLVYDVAHNIAKFEEHEVGGKKVKLCVHRKGATRAFGPGQEVLPADYRQVGQPVFIPGDMGTESYVLVGTEKAMKESFGSTCHGAGRVKSRAQAKREATGKAIKEQLEKEGIIIRAGNIKLLAEEAPLAYKDVSRVVNVCEGAGISLKVARLKPLIVVKG